MCKPETSEEMNPQCLDLRLLTSRLVNSIKYALCHRSPHKLVSDTESLFYFRLRVNQEVETRMRHNKRKALLITELTGDHVLLLWFSELENVFFLNWAKIPIQWMNSPIHVVIELQATEVSQAPR